MRLAVAPLSRLAALPLLVFVAAASAQAPQPLLWDCVQLRDADYNALCTVRDGAQAIAAGAADVPSSAALPDPLPGKPDMRPVSQRGADAGFAGDPWLVPLHSAPTDARFAETLLESVLCGTRSACRVSYREHGALVARR